MFSGCVVATGGLLFLGAITASVTGGLSLAVASGAAGFGSGVAAVGTVFAILNGVEYAETKEQIKTYTQKVIEARDNQERCQVERAELEGSLKRIETEIGDAEEIKKVIESVLDVYFIFSDELEKIFQRFQKKWRDMQDVIRFKHKGMIQA